MGAEQIAVKKLDLQRVTDSIIRPSNTTQYTALDAISTVTSSVRFTFDKPLKQGKRYGEIVKAVLTSSVVPTTLTLDAVLHLFRTNPAVSIDNNAFSVTDAELANCLGTLDFPLANFKLNALNAICTITPGFVFDLVDANPSDVRPSLYGQLVAANAYTPTTGEVLSIRMLIATY